MSRLAELIYANGVSLYAPRPHLFRFPLVFLLSGIPFLWPIKIMRLEMLGYAVIKTSDRRGTVKKGKNCTVVDLRFLIFQVAFYSRRM
jgi:hypothetical protein